ncbi:hypothetical protein [Weissella sagaensis]|uniref:hypothetical protein n=1 Tax=Weissella sagaensis TaxID=2559928 RepID=UPI0035126A4D
MFDHILGVIFTIILGYVFYKWFVTPNGPPIFKPSNKRKFNPNSPDNHWYYNPDGTPKTAEESRAYEEKFKKQHVPSPADSEDIDDRHDVDDIEAYIAAKIVMDDHDLDD